MKAAGVKKSPGRSGQRPAKGFSEVGNTPVSASPPLRIGRLFRFGFGSYLLLVIMVTGVQFTLEYRATRGRIQTEMGALCRLFQGSASEALWTLDQTRLEQVIQAIQSVPGVSGVRILSDHAEFQVQSGVMPVPERVPGGHWLEPYPSYTCPLVKLTPLAEEPVGQLLIAADRGIVLDRLQHRLIALLLNALIPVLGLGLILHDIFRLIRRRLRPVRQPGVVAADIHMTGNEQVVPVAVLQARLNEVRSEFIGINHNLEMRVAERERELKLAYERLTSIEVERTRIRERESLMRDVHDGFGSQLSSARLRAEKGDMNQSELSELLGECVSDLYLVVDTLHNTDGNLSDALRLLRNRTQRRLLGDGVELHWQLDVDETLLMPHQRIMSILRIVQEALNNALKHSCATHIVIEAGNQSDQLTLRVGDNGMGMPADIQPGRGLVNMQRRARELGGQLTFNPEQAGTAVTLTLPLR